MRVVVLAAIALGGCAPSSGLYPYRIVNDACQCERFEVSDTAAAVGYAFAATYSVDDGIRTTIDVEIQNNSDDTVYLSLAYIRVTSHNLSYQYNNRFLPIAIPLVAPHERKILTLTGSANVQNAGDPWLKIAGEELVVTLKGARIGHHTLATQTIRFVPYNPKLKT
jgi:hypothetical protein